ncbi:16S/23S rRNA (cytidine-2'-O)-methyltransferase [Humibacillus sp. DSM 29435]|nr:16S/23S rRNA (cytidine-2'-O)-methyltransferase [Humibacillus sp. DSM 29435]
MVSRGLARSRTQAHELVVSGGVVVNGRAATKPSTPVDDEADVVVTREADRWVGRAALKLLRAFELWPVTASGKRCLDVGASTGGFTQVLLEQEAAHVTALDVGRGQLVESIAADPRVLELSGTNVRSVDVEQLGGPFEVVVCDLSFISLTLALVAIRPLLRDDGDLVVLVKPQFEVGRERLGRRGVVTSAHEHRRVLRQVAEHALALGLHLHGAAPSPIAGGDGNREFLFWLAPRPSSVDDDADDMLERMHLEQAP